VGFFRAFAGATMCFGSLTGREHGRRLCHYRFRQFGFSAHLRSATTARGNFARLGVFWLPMSDEPSKSREFAIELARLATDDKCEEVTVMDLRGLSPVTDFFVICSGTSDRQMRTTAEHMMEYGKSRGEPPFTKAGLESASWILVDFVNVVVHIFTPEHRTYYDLELLWGDAPRIAWQRKESA
jgi:ribosome-associated protein